MKMRKSSDVKDEIVARASGNKEIYVFRDLKWEKHII